MEKLENRIIAANLDKLTKAKKNQPWQPSTIRLNP